jgi:hypothetical protein
MIVVPGDATVDQKILRMLAEERIKDAKALLRGKRWSFAYYVAGYSVECALKSCVLARMIHTAWIFDEKKKIPDFQVHDFGELVRLAGLKEELNNRHKLAAANGDPFAAHWGTVLQWDVTSRYTSKTEAEAKGLFEAITHKPHGALAWIRNYW